jgi:hypothetical protein
MVELAAARFADAVEAFPLQYIVQAPVDKDGPAPLVARSDTTMPPAARAAYVFPSPRVPIATARF